MSEQEVLFESVLLRLRLLLVDLRKLLIVMVLLSLTLLIGRGVPHGLGGGTFAVFPLFEGVLLSRLVNVDLFTEFQLVKFEVLNKRVRVD